MAFWLLCLLDLKRMIMFNFYSTDDCHSRARKLSCNYLLAFWGLLSLIFLGNSILLSCPCMFANRFDIGTPLPTTTTPHPDQVQLKPPNASYLLSLHLCLFLVEITSFFPDLESYFPSSLDKAPTVFDACLYSKLRNISIVMFVPISFRFSQKRQKKMQMDGGKQR